MKNIRLASPLYILRSECSEDLYTVLVRLGALGFEGVEFLSFFGKSAEGVRMKMEELGMNPIGNHVSFTDFTSDIPGTIALHKKVGCRYITIGNIPQDVLMDEEGFALTISRLTQIGKACREEGIRLLYHNHAFELNQKVRGKYLLEMILDETPGDFLELEPDLGWMAIGGADPVFFLEKYKNRCPVIHLKDFYASDISKIPDPGELADKRGTADQGCFEFRPVGYGVANVPQYMDKVCKCNPEWIVMDHDLAYERDSFTDLQLSLLYVRQLLAMV